MRYRLINFSENGPEVQAALSGAHFLKGERKMCFSLNIFYCLS